MAVELADDFAVAQRGVIQRVESRPMNERCSPSGDRIEVPVRWISEIDLTVSEKVKTEPTDLFCCCNQLVAMLSGQHLEEPRIERSLKEALFRIAEEAANTL